MKKYLLQILKSKHWSLSVSDQFLSELQTDLEIRYANSTRARTKRKEQYKVMAQKRLAKAELQFARRRDAINAKLERQLQSYDESEGREREAFMARIVTGNWLHSMHKRYFARMEESRLENAQSGPVATGDQSA